MKIFYRPLSFYADNASPSGFFRSLEKKKSKSEREQFRYACDMQEFISMHEVNKKRSYRTQEVSRFLTKFRFDFHFENSIFFSSTLVCVLSFQVWREFLISI